jgi:hypothetical protein
MCQHWRVSRFVNLLSKQSKAPTEAVLWSEPPSNGGKDDVKDSFAGSIGFWLANVAVAVAALGAVAIAVSQFYPRSVYKDEEEEKTDAFPII